MWFHLDCYHYHGPILLLLIMAKSTLQQDIGNLSGPACLKPGCLDSSSLDSERGLGFRVLGQSLGFGVLGQSLGFRVLGQSLGFGVLGQSLGFRAEQAP